MRMTAVTCAILLSICICIVTVSRAQNLKGLSERGIEFSTNGRQSRATTTVVGALLKTARVVDASEWMRLYVKPGGNRQAMKDLRSLKPRHIDDYGFVKWAEIGYGITSRQVRVEELLGRTTLTIWRKSSSNSGHAQLSIDKIEYF